MSWMMQTLVEPGDYGDGMSQDQYPRPEDFIKEYSPLGPAELFLSTLESHPSSRVLELLRKIRRRLPVVHATNDMEAKRLLARISSQYAEVNPQIIQQALTDKFRKDHQRKLEYAFYAKCLVRDDVAKRTIVDFGGGRGSFSTVVPMLFRFPGTEIVSVDISNHGEASEFGVRYVQGDCRGTGLPSSSADVVSLISTLEHVGLGRYGDPLDVEGDVRCIEEVQRVLRPGGHLILTTPYGYPTVVFNLHRIYDEGRLQMITRGFEPVLIEYSKLGQLCTKAEIEGARATAEIPGYYDANKQHPDAQGSVLGLFRKP